jgi:hypothetical protein
MAPQSTPHHDRWHELDQRIAELAAREAQLRADLRVARWDIPAAAVRYGIRRGQVPLRRPAESIALWNIGLISIGAFTAAAFMGAVVSVYSGSSLLGLLAFLVVGALVAAGLAYLLFVPATEELPATRGAAAAALRAAQEHRNDLRVELRRVQQELAADRRTRDELLNSKQLRREVLLQQPWRTMRSRDFEKFLTDALGLLGATVKHTGRRGDAGVDLVVEHQSRRIAVHARGYMAPLDSAAVKQAVLGMSHYHCDQCAVIGNSRPAPDAIQEATGRKCEVIGEDELPALVRGELSL